MQRFDQPVDFAQIAVFGSVEHAVDKVARQAVVFVERFYEFVVEQVGIGIIACHVRPFPCVA